MSTFMNILMIIGMIAIIWFLFRTIKNNPGMFTKKKLGQSFMTMGWLAIGLIGFIAVCILVLKSG